MWLRGKPVRAIAAALGLTSVSVQNYRFKRGLPVRRITPGRPRKLRQKDGGGAKHKIERVAFETSRLMEFCTQRELINQTGHQQGDWPRVIIKELVDNALDACEEAGIAPIISIAIVTSTETGTTFVVEDNGPGIPAATVAGILDYKVRVSSREAYVSPTRGAQGNALKTVLPMGYVLQGTTDETKDSTTIIEARGIAHTIQFGVDKIRMEPMIRHDKATSSVRTGTRITISWPRHTLGGDLDHWGLAELASDFAWVNPHLTMRLTWNGVERVKCTASNPAWTKWLPSTPTCPHWYDYQRFERYMAAHVARGLKKGRAKYTVRQFLGEFRGLSSTGKQKAILQEFDAAHLTLEEFFGTASKVNSDRIGALLAAMKRHTKPVPAAQIGVIGKEHFLKLFTESGGDPKTFTYQRKCRLIDGVPRVIEFAFGVHTEGLRDDDRRGPGRRLINAVNWSAAIGNPFRLLGRLGEGADSLLTSLRAQPTDPVIAALHYACPRVAYLDRGKSSIMV
jgi:DNA topoisomerase VI subunit B